MAKRKPKLVAGPSTPPTGTWPPGLSMLAAAEAELLKLVNEYGPYAQGGIFANAPKAEGRRAKLHNYAQQAAVALATVRSLISPPRYMGPRAGWLEIVLRDTFLAGYNAARADVALDKADAGSHLKLPDAKRILRDECAAKYRAEIISDAATHCREVKVEKVDAQVAKRLVKEGIVAKAKGRSVRRWRKAAAGQ